MNYDCLNTRRDEMRRTLSQIFEQPIYIVFSGELGISVDKSVAGLTCPALSSLIQEKCPDEFRGHAPGMVICDRHLRHLDPALMAFSFDATVLHEAAHLANRTHTEQDFPSHLIETAAATPPATWSSYAGQPKWATHDARFIRSLCHVHHRLESRKHRVSLDAAFRHERYGLSPVAAYVESLGDEPKRTSWLPLREVLGRPMPAEFQKLWARDVLASLNVEPS